MTSFTALNLAGVYIFFTWIVYTAYPGPAAVAASPAPWSTSPPPPSAARTAPDGSTRAPVPAPPGERDNRMTGDET